MKYRIFVGVICSGVLVLSLLYIHSLHELERREEQLTAMRSLVQGLKLTDLAIWTEARYTRHPSQADLFSPFQDFPSSIEHFPAGSIIPPPVTGEWSRY